MKLMGQIVLFLVAIAFLQAAAAGLMLLLLVLAVICLIAHPRETLGLLTLLLVTGLIQRFPLAAVAVFGMAGSCWWIRRRRASPSPAAYEPPLLPKPLEPGSATASTDESA